MVSAVIIERWLQWLATKNFAKPFVDYWPCECSTPDDIKVVYRDLRFCPKCKMVNPLGPREKQTVEQ